VRSAELVGVAQPIARCGEVGGIGRRRQVAQRGMRALAIVVVGPRRDPGLGVIEAEEQGFVEELIPHSAIEAFTKAVLHRFSRHDEVPGDLVVNEAHYALAYTHAKLIEIRPPAEPGLMLINQEVKGAL
jgi:hypothetical protein